MVPDNRRRSVETTAGRASLIPGLPDDVAMLCLLRVPRVYHANLRSVCVQWNSVLSSNEFYNERKRLGLVDSWLFVMGTDLLPSAQSCMYDLGSKRLLWKVDSTELPQRAAGFDGFRFGAIDGCLLVVGGRRGSLCKAGDDQFTIFNTITNKWSQGASLRIPRCHFACGAINGQLYLAGGYSNAGKVEQSLEIYNLERNEWSSGASMPIALHTIESDVVFQGKLYVRGFVMCRQESPVLVYDPASNTWEVIEAMSSNLDDGELIATDHALYYLNASGSLEKFNTKEMKWQKAGKIGQTENEDLNTYAHRAFGLGNQMFILTGTNAGLSTELREEGVVCHNLFQDNQPWYRAGAIIQA